jgi:hypothetical protein
MHRRRRETRAAQGVASAFAVLFLQNQQTATGTGKSAASRRPDQFRSNSAPCRAAAAAVKYGKGENEHMKTARPAPSGFAAKAKDLQALRDAVVEASTVSGALWISYIFVFI